MSITFSIKGQNFEPRPGDRFTQDLNAPDQGSFMIGTISADLEPIYLPGPVTLEAMLQHARAIDRPVWEWVGRHGWAYGWTLQVEPEGSGINVHNGNAIDLLRVLGLSSFVSDAPGFLGCPGSPDAGELPAAELRDRARYALGSAEVSDDRAVSVPPTSRGRIHTGGREAGYLDRQLRALIALCDRADLAALCRGRTAVVTWS